MNALIDFFVDRYKATLTFLALIIVWGLSSVALIPASAYSDINIPYVFVSTEYEGASPEDVERLITRPLEDRFRSLSEVKSMQSWSRDGMGYLILEFPDRYPKEDALVDVKDAIDEILPDLPEESEKPFVKEFSFDAFPVMNLNFISAASSERELIRFAKEMATEIESLPGVLEARLSGAPDEVLEAIVDKTKLDSYQASALDIYNAIQQNNRAIPAGNIISGTGKFSVIVPSVFETAEDVKRIPILESDNAVVSLDDLVEVKRTFRDKDSFSRVNGQPSATISIYKKTDAREVVVANQIYKIISESDEILPPDIDIVITEDRTQYSVELISEIVGNTLAALILVVTIVVAAMGLRSSSMVALAIPACFLFACIFLNIIEYTFNFMVCFGFLISLGMLIDGSVVVVEYADRKMSEGLDRVEAYKRSAKRMFWPVIISIGTTLAIFFPLLFWEGISGQFMRPMITTLFLVLSASILYALAFTPAIGSIFGSLGRRNFKTLQNSALLENGDPKTLDGFTGRYARFLDKLLDRPGFVISFLLLTVVTIYSIYGQHGPGGSFFIEEDPDTIIVEVQARGNLNANETLEYLKEVEKIVLTVEGPESVFLEQAGSNDPRDRGNADSIGKIYVGMPFDRDSLIKTGSEVLDELQYKLNGIPGIKIAIRERDSGPPSDNPIEIDVFGPDSQMVYEATIALTEYIDEQVPGAKNVYNTIPREQLKWKLNIDKEKASQFGVTTSEIGTAIQFLTAGVKVGEYRPTDLDEAIDIRVRFPESQRRLDLFDQLTISTRFGSVPLSSFVSVNPSYEAPAIRRVEGERAFTIAADYAPGALIEDVLPKINQWILDNNEYQKLQFDFGGQAEQAADDAEFFLFAAIIGLFLMAILLMIQLNSFYQVWIVISAVFLSTAGVYLGHLITQYPISFLFTNLGIIALAGIVVNNNIVLVDTYNVLRRENIGASQKDLIVRTAAQRIRPIILTTATTVVGLMPLAMGLGVDLIARDIGVGGRVVEWWSPLSFAVVWGLTFASLMTLILTPCWLMLPTKIKELYAGLNSVKSEPKLNN